MRADSVYLILAAAFLISPFTHPLPVSRNAAAGNSYDGHITLPEPLYLSGKSSCGNIESCFPFRCRKIVQRRAASLLIRGLASQNVRRR